MAKVKFTAGRVEAFRCPDGVGQAFLWDTEAPGLGLRATPARQEHGREVFPKSYIFQAKLNGQAIRVTIGGPATWTIDAAQAEARRLKVLIDQGQDPRKVRADALAAEQVTRDAAAAEAAARKAREFRESVTVGEAWAAYVKERALHWSDLHLRDHERMVQAGGEKRKRSPKLTEPGPLASLMKERLVDLTSERIEAWAKAESKVRPTRARLGLRLLKAFLFWCAVHKDYADICNVSAAQNKKARESLGKSKPKNDVLQREQLKAWFGAVRQIGNPVIAAYLQTLLLTGARREELATLRWEDVDFQWNSLRLNDKVEDFRMVPLTPYIAHLLKGLPRRNKWVFSSPTAESGRLTEPSIAHRKACAVAGLEMTLHGLRRSFATLSEWTETPAGIAAQIQGHAPQGVREQNYIRRPLDLLRMWHTKIEGWILEQAGVTYQPRASKLQLAKTS